MFNSKIKKRVMTKIHEKIAKAEETHRQMCIDIDAEAEAKKEQHAEEMAHQIVGKVL